MKLRILFIALLSVLLFSCEDQPEKQQVPQADFGAQFAPATVISPAQGTLETSSSLDTAIFDLATVGIASHYNLQISTASVSGTANYAYEVQVALDSDSTNYATLYSRTGLSAAVDTLITGNINSGKLRLFVTAPSSTQVTTISPTISLVKRTPG
jgi:hypothetical protein